MVLSDIKHTYYAIECLYKKINQEPTISIIQHVSNKNQDLSKNHILGRISIGCNQEI
jgi:hypothetical protein